MEDDSRPGPPHAARHSISESKRFPLPSQPPKGKVWQVSPFQYHLWRTVLQGPGSGGCWHLSTAAHHIHVHIHIEIHIRIRIPAHGGEGHALSHSLTRGRSCGGVCEHQDGQQRHRRSPHCPSDQPPMGPPARSHHWAWPSARGKAKGRHVSH